MDRGPSAGASREVSGYLAVFAALLALTMATVILSRLNLATPAAVTVAIAIAMLKASLVAMFFMHLKGERPVVHAALVLTAVLFLALILFVLWTEGDHLFGTRFTGAFEVRPR